MSRRREESERKAPAMKIHPHQKTMGVVSPRSAHDRSASLSGRRMPIIAPMGEMTTTSAERPSAIQNRVRMSASIDAAIAGSDMLCDMLAGGASCVACL